MRSNAATIHIEVYDPQTDKDYHYRMEIPRTELNALEKVRSLREWIEHANMDEVFVAQVDMREALGQRDRLVKTISNGIASALVNSIGRLKDGD